MSETNPPVSTPTPASGISDKAKRTRNVINRAWLKQITATSGLIAVVEREEYGGIMADGGIDAEFLDGLKALLAQAGDIISQAEQKSSGAMGATKIEKASRERLITAIRVVQARAKQTHAASRPEVLKDYAVGKDMAGSRSMLESSAQSIINKLAGDALKGLKPAQIAELKDALAAYKQTETKQQSEWSGAATQRVSLKELVDKIAAKRREIQFAVDAEWPASNKVNRGIRREFGIPGGKALPR